VCLCFENAPVCVSSCRVGQTQVAWLASWWWALVGVRFVWVWEARGVVGGGGTRTRAHAQSDDPVISAHSPPELLS
jgi:hypothetical protein